MWRDRSLLISGILIAALCAAATWLPPWSLAPLNRHTAQSAVMLLGLFGPMPELSGHIMRHGDFAVAVIGECTALYMIIIFCGFVASWNAPPGAKAAGMILGVPLLQALNVARIAIVFAVGVHAPWLFEPVHAYLGQVAMVVTVCGACLLWHQWVSDGANGPWWFLAKAAACSAVPFAAWLHLNRGYVLLTDRAVSILFGLGGHRLRFAHDHELYFHTFNVVTFAALILATECASPRRRLAALGRGLPILVAGHILFRIGNVAFSAFNVEEAFRFANAVSLTGQYLAPLFLWLLFTRCIGRSGNALHVVTDGHREVMP